MAKMTPAEEARYALDWGLGSANLKPEAQAEYDRLLAERERLAAEGGPVPTAAEPADALAGFTTRTPPEIRERILAMFKKGNSKYAKPFDKDRLAMVSVFGGNWEEYGQIVLQMAILDTLLSIEEKLDRLTGQQED